MPGGGKWTFNFRFSSRNSLDLEKYQTLLQTIREEFAPKFAEMNPNEGTVVWTNANGTGGATASYANNTFAKFSYNCTRPHVNQGAGHGTWTLLWNPKEKKIQHKLHARCAPSLFKDLSNQIQEKLAQEFPQHFMVNWQNGISGYEHNQQHAEFQNAIEGIAATLALLALLHDDDEDDSDSDDDHLPIVQDFDLSDDRCPHWYPWGYCPEECHMALFDDDDYY